MSDEATLQLTDAERQQALEFTRHYDNLLWVVTSLLMPANAALLAIAAEKPFIQIGVLGVLLSLVTVFFAASFRLLRLRLHARLNRDAPSRHAWLYAGSAGWAGQWKIYVLFFVVLAGLWISLLWQHFPEHRRVWLAVSLISIALFGWLYFAARRHTPDDALGS